LRLRHAGNFPSPQIDVKVKNDNGKEIAFEVKAVEKAVGRTLVFIHISSIFDHHLGRGATS
jgi:hypothetical protein